MYIVSIIHSLKVKGTRQTVAFFVVVAVIPFFAEYMGCNYDWFFGAYEYSESLGPRLRGVPLLVISVLGTIVYTAYMLIDWLLGLKGEQRGTKWYGKVIWSALIALTTGIVAGAWDMLVDPFSVSGVWMKVLALKLWWWWSGGTYLLELQVWQGSGGIPVKNFVGWVEVTAFIVFIFNLFFQKKDNVTEKLVNVIPFLIYSYMYYTFIGALLEMNWYDNLIPQAVLIGTFTMGPVIMFGLVKLFYDYWRPPELNT